MNISENTAHSGGKSILVLGGDGFCGWPTALRFSSLGNRVTILDNGSRRAIDSKLGTASLTPICSLDERVAAWADVGGQKIETRQMDLAQDYTELVEFLHALRPDIIVHFAEQRSSPYSMLSSEGARYSVDNNIRATHNLLAALVEVGLRSHVLHLGTIGVYGYASAGLKLPEGYLPITALGVDGRTVEKEILYPGEPDTIYHMTKVLDQQLFAFYARYYGLTITDLHQGIVWGTQTTETKRDVRLVNRFDHDPIYGTVVNRFLVQAFENRPLTIYGSGSQTKAFIHIEDMLTCLTLAAASPPKSGDRVQIMNQFAETCSINDLAAHLSKVSGATLSYIENPRKEPEGNEFDLDRSTLRNLGLNPRFLEDTLGDEIADLVDLIAPTPSTAADDKSVTA
jgi:UDP-sulfoquinovose synthase